jgi:hypothetical protein
MSLNHNELFQFLDFISEKDRFLLIYEKFLSKRLIRRRAELFQEEEGLKFLAEKIGASLVSRLFSKLSDFRNACALLNEFRISSQQERSEKPNEINSIGHKINNIEYSILILAQGLWSFPDFSGSEPPKTIMHEWQTIKNWYGKHFPHRRLKWIEDEEEWEFQMKDGRRIICGREIAEILANWSEKSGEVANQDVMRKLSEKGIVAIGENGTPNSNQNKPK